MGDTKKDNNRVSTKNLRKLKVRDNRMTVEELINRLQQIDNKNKEIIVMNFHCDRTDIEYIVNDTEDVRLMVDM